MLNIVNLPTIVDLNPRIVLFDKESKQVLLILDYSELGLMRSVYKKYKHKISDKQDVWIDEKTFKVLSKLGYEEKLNEVGFKIEYNDIEVVLKNNILSLIDVKFPIVLFEEIVTSQKFNKTILDQIKKRLEGKGFTVFQTRSIQTDIENGNSISNMVLEFFTGHKIQNNKFVTTESSQYNQIFYYDNNPNRILYLKKINESLNVRLESSKPDIANNIKEYINQSDMKLTLCGVTSNEVNPISKTVVKLNAFVRYIRSFESWNANSGS